MKRLGSLLKNGAWVWVLTCNIKLKSLPNEKNLRVHGPVNLLLLIVLARYLNFSIHHTLIKTEKIKIYLLSTDGLISSVATVSVINSFLYDFVDAITMWGIEKKKRSWESSWKNPKKLENPEEEGFTFFFRWGVGDST